ncbi:MAG: hypothetical protein ACR2LQ_08500 [Acidimicrobiales bacterium]
MSEVDGMVAELAEGMVAAMDSFDSGDLPLERLVWQLESRISAMEGTADGEWIEELRSGWWQLEYVNALVLDVGGRSLTEQERRSIDEAVSELRAMLAAY